MVLAILWCTDVFAHLDGDPIAHFQPGEEAGGTYTFGTVAGTYEADPCLRKRCAGDGETPFPYKGGHGHINSETPRIWGYWTCGGYAVVMGIDDPGCPTASDGDGNNDVDDNNNNDDSNNNNGE